MSEILSSFIGTNAYKKQKNINGKIRQSIAASREEKAEAGQEALKASKEIRLGRNDLVNKQFRVNKERKKLVAAIEKNAFDKLVSVLSVCAIESLDIRSKISEDELALLEDTMYKNVESFLDAGSFDDAQVQALYCACNEKAEAEEDETVSPEEAEKAEESFNNAVETYMTQLVPEVKSRIYKAYNVEKERAVSLKERLAQESVEMHKKILAKESKNLSLWTALVAAYSTDSGLGSENTLSEEAQAELQEDALFNAFSALSALETLNTANILKIDRSQIRSLALKISHIGQ